MSKKNNSDHLSIAAEKQESEAYVTVARYHYISKTIIILTISGFAYLSGAVEVLSAMASKIPF